MINQPQNPALQASQAAIIDQDGREIPITEQMILEACRQLEQQLQHPQQRQDN